MNLTASLPATAFLHGESIPVDCVLDRTADKPLRAPSPELNDAETRFVLRRAGGAPATLTGRLHQAARGEGMVPLSEYRERPAAWRVDWRNDVLFFEPPPDPGDYRLHVEFHAGGESAASSELAFKVLPAHPAHAGFGWFPTSAVRGSWEGAWTDEAGGAHHLMYQAAYYENPALVDRGVRLAEVPAGSGAAELAVRFDQPVMATWRWVLWTEGAKLRGARAPLAEGKIPAGGLEAALEESRAWLLPRPVQAADGGCTAFVAGEHAGRPVLRPYRFDAHGRVQAGEPVELPFLPQPGDLARVAREGGERAWLVLVDRSAHDRVRLLRRAVGEAGGAGWETLAEFHGTLGAWSAQDAGAGKPAVTVLVRSGERWECGSFPLEQPGPWKPEQLLPVMRAASGAAQPFPDAQVREAAVAAGRAGEAPLVAVFGADGALWAAPRGPAAVLRRVPLPAMAHGARSLQACVTASGRRFAGFVENEVGWRWVRVGRDAASGERPPGGDPLTP